MFLRIEVVMIDQTLEQPYHLAKWHMFLPSDVLLLLHAYHMMFDCGVVFCDKS